MKKTHKNQSGFSAVEGVLIIIVVVLIGVAGWLVYKNNHKKAETKTATTQTTTPSKTTSTTPTAEQQFLTIKEWGIKVPLSSSIADAYYAVSNNTQSNGQPNTIWLGLKSLDAKGCSASNGNSGGTSAILAAVTRTLPTDTDPVSGETYKQKNPNGATVGQYYYGYATFGGLQKGSRCTTDANAATLDTAFKAAANGIVAN